MNGYVWAAYAIAFGLLIGYTLSIRLRRRNVGEVGDMWGGDNEARPDVDDVAAGADPDGHRDDKQAS